MGVSKRERKRCEDGESDTDTESTRERKEMSANIQMARVLTTFIG